MIASKVSRIALLLSASVALFACEATDRAEKFRATVKDEISELQKTGQRPLEPESVDVSRSVDTPFLGNRTIRNENGSPLPVNLEAENGVLFATAQPMKLREIASQLSSRIGIPVRVGNVTGATTCSASANAGAGGTSAANTQAAAAAAAEIDQATKIVYSGPLSRLLRNIGSRYGVEWTYSDGSIVFYRYETSVWNIYASPSSTQLETGIQNQSASNITSNSASSGGAASSGGSGQNGVTQSLRLTSERMSTLDEIDRTVKSFLPPGSCAIMSPSTRTLAVTTLPSVRRQVESYIRDQNERMTRQASIELIVYNVIDTGADNYGLDLASAFRNTRSGFNFNTTGAPAGINTTTGSFGFGILNAPVDTAFSGITNAAVTARALSSIGTTTQRDGGTFSVTSGRPIMVNSVETLAILDNFSPSVSGSSSSVAATAKLSREDVGFSATLFPNILPRGRVQLSFMISISDSRGIRQVTSGSGASQITLEDPQISRRSFPLDITLLSGQSAVLTTLDRSRSQTNDQGVGSHRFWGLGGGRTASSSKSYLVIIVTPKTIESPLDSTFLDPVSRSFD